MSGEKLEEQAINTRYETNEKATGRSIISVSQCHVCFEAFKEKLCFPLLVNSLYKIFQVCLDAIRAD